MYYTISDETGKQEGSEQSYIPMDRQALDILLFEHQGVVTTYEESEGGTFNDHIEFVDPSPLPSEYEDKDLPDQPTPPLQTPKPIPLARGSHKETQVLEMLVPIFEDIVVSGVIAFEFSRKNACQSCYFKLYQLYNPSTQNGPVLAEIMRRGRNIPERYSKKYEEKKLLCTSQKQREVMSAAILDTLTLSGACEVQCESTIELYFSLKIFLNALITAAPWDYKSPHEICADIYFACDSPTPADEHATQNMLNAGCSLERINVIYKLIRDYTNRSSLRIAA